MARDKTSQLLLYFPDDHRAAQQFVVSRDLLRHRFCNALLKKLFYVRRYFPELEGRQIKVGITRGASGMAVPGGHEIWVNPSGLSYHTLTHELVHLLQGTCGIPSGERSCDVYSLARHWTLNDSLPHYVRIPPEFCDMYGRIPYEYASILYAAAREALDLRKRGKRRYISHFEKTLRRMQESLIPLGAYPFNPPHVDTRCESAFHFPRGKSF